MRKILLILAVFLFALTAKAQYVPNNVIYWFGMNTTGQPVIDFNPWTSLITIPTVHNTVSRSLNSAYTISATQQADVTYTIRIAYTVTGIAGSTGSVSLQYSTNAGSTYTTLSTVSNNVNLGLALSGYNDYCLSGIVPANGLVKLTSTVTNATNTYQTGEETY